MYKIGFDRENNLLNIIIIKNKCYLTILGIISFILIVNKEYLALK